MGQSTQSNHDINYEEQPSSPEHILSNNESPPKRREQSLSNNESPPKRREQFLSNNESPPKRREQFLSNNESPPKRREQFSIARSPHKTGTPRALPKRQLSEKETSKDGSPYKGRSPSSSKSSRRSILDRSSGEASPSKKHSQSSPEVVGGLSPRHPGTPASRRLFEKDTSSEGSPSKGRSPSSSKTRRSIFIRSSEEASPSKKHSRTPKKQFKGLLKSPRRRMADRKSKDADRVTIGSDKQDKQNKLILQGIEELKLKLQLLHVNMGRVLTAVQPDSAGNVDWPEGMPTFPVSDSKKLAEMEKFLEKKKNKDAVAEVLVTAHPVVDVAGKAVVTMEELAVKLMRDLLTNGFAREFNWCGGYGKRSFENLEMKKLVDRVMRRCFPDTGMEPAYQKIKRWLATAAQRRSADSDE